MAALPQGTGERAGRGRSSAGLHLSASGYERLGRCEAQWLYARDDTEELVPGEPLKLGKLMHRFVQEWWQTGVWDVDAALAEHPAWRPGYELPAEFKRADALMGGYVAQYGAERAAGDWRPEAIELEFDVPLALGVGLHGYLDGLFRRQDGTLWVWELKTMSRWNRMDRVPFEVQPQTYLYAARELGYPVVGVLWDAVSTYEYKDGIGPGSFRRLELPYNPALVDWTMENYGRAAKRAKAIVKNPDLAVRSVGDACTWCPARPNCHPQS